MTSAAHIHRLPEKNEEELNALPDRNNNDRLQTMESGEFMDEDRDRRVTTVSPRGWEEDDSYLGDTLPKQWFKWKK